MSNQERKSWTEKFAETSKWIDKWGIAGGLAMIAYGIIVVSGTAVTGGALLAGTSAATYYIGERVRKKAENKRKAREAIIYQSKNKK